MTRSEIQLMGRFSVCHNGRELKELHAERLTLLLAYLLLNSDFPISRKHLAFLFWPDSIEKQARTNFRNLLHQLRRAFPEIVSFLEVDNLSIRCRCDASLLVDVNQFREALVEAKSAKGEADRIRHLQEAVDNYYGELLPGFYEDWVLVEREELHQSYLGALAQLAKLLEDHRCYEGAIEAVDQMIRNDPLNESAYLHSMRLHALIEDRAGALQVYHVCATMLMRELGMEPAREIQSFYVQLVGPEKDTEAEVREEKAKERKRLIGRKQEWSRLRDMWGSAQKGKPALVVILGEAGIGKTHLASEMMQWARRQGIRSASAQCYAMEGNLPFAPIVAWLRTPEIREEMENLAPLWRREIARLVPELDGDKAKAEDNAQKWQRQRLFEAVARGLLGSGAPRLLLLDDAQWSDQETLEFLHYLMRYDPSAKLLVLATARLEEVDGSHPLNKLRDGLLAHGKITEIELGPLNKDELSLLASDLLGKELSAETEARIFDETEGNPFFAVEVLRSGDYESGGPLPSSLRSILTRRLDQLSPAARNLAGLAATIGREFDFPLLLSTSQKDENALVQAVDELWSRRIIQIQQGDTYSFTHGKLLDATYETLSPIRRQILHRRIAEALLARGAESALIASHFEKAGQYSQALGQYLNAAEVARRVFANQNAIVNLERALELMTEKIGIKNEANKRLASEIYEMLGDLYGMGSKEVDAIPAYRKSLALIPTSARLQQARLLGKLARVTGNRNPKEGKDIYLQAEEALGKPPVEGNADWWRAWFTIQFNRIWMFYDSSDLDGMQSAFETVRPVVDRLKETDKLAEYYFLLPALSFRRDGYLVNASMLETSSLSLELSKKGTNLELQTRTHFGYGFIQYLAGNFDVAIQYLMEGLRLAGQIGYVEQEAYCVTYLAGVHRRAGHLDECKKYAEQALALCKCEGFTSFASTSIANLGWIAWRQNDLKQAKTLSLQALEAWGPYYPFRWYALWTLIDLSLLALRTKEAIEFARQLKEPGQQAFAEEGDDLLTETLHAADRGDLTCAASLLVKTVDWAKKNNYL